MKTQSFTAIIKSGSNVTSRLSAFNAHWSASSRRVLMTLTSGHAQFHIQGSRGAADEQGKALMEHLSALLMCTNHTLEKFGAVMRQTTSAKSCLI